MLDAARDDVAAAREQTQRSAFDCQVVRLGRTRGEHDLARVGVDQRCDLRARGFDELSGTLPEGVLAAGSVAVVLGQRRQDRFNDTPIARCRGVVIEEYGLASVQRILQRQLTSPTKELRAAERRIVGERLDVFKSCCRPEFSRQPKGLLGTGENPFFTA